MNTLMHALGSDAALYVYAVLSGIAGLVVAFRCQMHNCKIDQENRARSVVVHLVISLPLLYGTGLLLTAGMLPGSVSLAHIFDFGQMLAIPFALIGVIVCVVPAVFAAMELRGEPARMAKIASHYKRHAIAAGAGEPPDESDTPAADTSPAPRKALDIRKIASGDIEPTAVDMTTRVQSRIAA